MKYRNFGEYLGKKHRDDMRKLELLAGIMGVEGIKNQLMINGDHEVDPYIYILNNKKDTSFEGVRVYIIGSHVAFRSQRQPESQPFGTAYLLDVEDFFYDLLEDEKMTPENAAILTGRAIKKELLGFFEQSRRAETGSFENSLRSKNDPVQPAADQTVDFSQSFHA